ncbi:hypothetical protein I552_10207 [Mycobacterium xenopi 3993]|nr:hypothetical protein I552_9660 [Mycobacterium xenopi 3993]EUA31265.1 hypothetical protein I552_10207 [Mycobacterium xenopi 3993]
MVHAEDCAELLLGAPTTPHQRMNALSNELVALSHMVGGLICCTCHSRHHTP